MGVALGTGNRVPDHAVTRIPYSSNVLRCARLPQPRPAGTRLKLVVRAEQCVIATDAAVESLVVEIPVFSAEGDFSIPMASDIEFPRRQLLPPLIIALHHFGHPHLLQPLP